MTTVHWQQMPLVNFEHLNLPDKPHYCLIQHACMKGRCLKAPIFRLSLSQLKQRWQAMIHQQPRVKLLRQDDKHWQYQYVQRSKWFRFPDLIDVQFMQIDSKQTTLQAYSRSIYGHYDFGVNCRRLMNWIENLKHEH